MLFSKVPPCGGSRALAGKALNKPNQPLLLGWLRQLPCAFTDLNGAPKLAYGSDTGALVIEISKMLGSAEGGVISVPNRSSEPAK